MGPAGFLHGWLILNIAGPPFVRDKVGNLGVVTGADTGFALPVASIFTR